MLETTNNKNTHVKLGLITTSANELITKATT